jgi:PAS domain S-box-containing protein
MAARILVNQHMHYVGCAIAPFETLGEACEIYGISLRGLLAELNATTIESLDPEYWRNLTIISKITRPVSQLRRYTIAVLLTSGALALAFLGRGLWGTAATYSFLLGAVMLSSWISGLGPGILSTVLGTVAADYFLIAPLNTLTFDSSRLVQLSAFVAIAVLISSLNAARRRAVAALAIQSTQLENRVRERTAELAQSERNFRGLIDAAPDAILVIDTDGRVVRMNDEAERLFGYTRDALLGRDVEMIIPERFRAAHHAKRETYEQAPTPRTLAGELAAKHADGTEFPVEIRISLLDAQGQRSIVGIVRDVTERDRAQQTQRRLVHDLGERMKELTALHATSRLLNEPASPGEVLARIVELLPVAWQYPEITSARITTEDIDVRTDLFELTPWVQRADFTTSGGRTGAIEIIYRDARPNADEGPFLAEERNLIESLADMLRAYFERVQAEEHRLNLARAEAARLEAEHANSAKDQFLATLSHELRSPLNVMLGWTQMLRSGHVSAERADRGFEILERSVRLQAQLIEDLLDVSRIIAGKLRVEKRRIDLSAIVDAAVDAARPAARAKTVTLTAQIEPSLYMEADAQRLQQVVSNLLTNALKFTLEGGSIAVGVERVEDRAQVVVRDTGIGIAAGLLPRIFDRFQQGDSSTTRTHRGLGLGLAIVKHLVEQHGGQVAAASAGSGHGSTFTIALPLLKDVTLTPSAGRSSVLDGSLLSGVRVLVVDDEADARITLGTILEQFGAQPTVVASAQDAFDSIADGLPDVLLSDIAMPNENGYALIRRIRRTVNAERLPAAALSAYVDGDSKAQALDAGFQTYLSKPVEPTLLATTIASLLHRAAAP